MSRDDAQAILDAMPSLNREHLTSDIKEPEIFELNHPTHRNLESDASKSGVKFSRTLVSSELTAEKGRKSVSPTDRPRRKMRYRNMSKLQATTPFESYEWRNSLFFGFYVLFWVVVAVSAMKVLLENFLVTGVILDTHILRILERDLIKVALTDLCMYLAMYFTYGIQVLVKRGLLDWDYHGWILQQLWQVTFFATFISLARYKDYPWIGQIFLALHALTMIMKQHSYAVYNGYCWSITKELKLCNRILAETTDKKISEEARKRVEFCKTELNLQSTKIRYPANITLKDFFDYTMFPTVVYELEFPRTPSIRWKNVLERMFAIFGIFFLLIMVAEQCFHPVAMSAIALRGRSLSYRWKNYPIVLMNLFPPFIVCYLLVFYLIWEAILGCIAELTRFGDREFYRDWWNSTDWEKFARDWNVPIHNFLLRHVYHSSVSILQLSRFQATLFTYLLSAAVHELTMFVIFGRIRGYLFALQLSQLPLQLLCQTKFMQARPVIGNVIFWLGICIGPSILCSLYLTF